MSSTILQLRFTAVLITKLVPSHQGTKNSVQMHRLLLLQLRTMLRYSIVSRLDGNRSWNSQKKTYCRRCTFFPVTWSLLVALLGLIVFTSPSAFIYAFIKEAAAIVVFRFLFPKKWNEFYNINLEYCVTRKSSLLHKKSLDSIIPMTFLTWKLKSIRNSTRFVGKRSDKAIWCPVKYGNIVVEFIGAFPKCQ